MTGLCQICYKEIATETCVLCGRRVCKGCFAGNGLCKACARGRVFKK